MSEKEVIRKLKAENRRLRRENEYWRQRNHVYKTEKETLSEASGRFRESARAVSLLHARTYFGYLIERFRRSHLFLVYDKTRFAVRGFFFARKVWQLLIFLAAFLGFGAQFLLIAGALTVFLPSALIFSFLIGIYSYFVQKKWKKYLYSVFAKDHISRITFVFLPKKGDARYFSRFLSEMAKDQAVFLVFRSARESGFAGISQKEHHIYRIHVSFYFSFEKAWKSMKIVKVYL